VTDPAFEGVFYKLAGYRLLGPRAVRVDILERLADLIRPTIHWKPGSELPDGAFGGGKFIVTPAMMSILGATADDMEAVLKGLGYKHEPMDAGKAEQILAELQATHAPKPLEAQPAADEVLPQQEGEKDETTVESATENTSDAAGDVSTPIDIENAEPAETPEEPPKPVLVWHQVRFERPANRSKSNAPGEHKNKRKGGDKARGDFKGKGKPGGKRPQNTHAAPRKEKKADPDSPFAKLQALKEQLGK
jgi:ATP-dependent RNA helicase SUPV3L1/SUV3